MTIEIKEASIDEIDIVYRTMEESFKEYIGKLNPPSGALRETITDILDNMKRSGGSVIAWNGNIAAGSAKYRFSEDFIYIGRVSVLPEFRGKGICKSMLKFIEDKARARDIFESRVEVRLSIPANIALYKRLKYEVIEHKFYPDRSDSWYVMSKNLKGTKV
jgi:ribosomal protein S18 acetylase RimI-like enzyme